jgi:hypothetical protein
VGEGQGEGAKFGTAPRLHPHPGPLPSRERENSEDHLSSRERENSDEARGIAEHPTCTILASGSPLPSWERDRVRGAMT